MIDSLTYSSSGVDIDAADIVKRGFVKSLETTNHRVLNKVGAFASLFDGYFPDIKHPVLVLKTEEPGSKQKIAFKYVRIESICYDMINHLVNDIIVMGATPLAIQDAIICGKLEKEKVSQIVASIAKACNEQGCALTGGETSIQPGIIEDGQYILTSSIVGIVEKDAIIDGSKIREGDIVLALASNGLHTNGYSLVRTLMDKKPKVLDMKIDGMSFLETILIPHRCYYKCIKDLFILTELHGMAHITGGGIGGNVNRILPNDLDALISANRIKVPNIFGFIKEHGNVPETDMLKTFNNGVGLTMIVEKSAVTEVTTHILSKGCDCYEIGRIIKGTGKVAYEGHLSW